MNKHALYLIVSNDAPEMPKTWVDLIDLISRNKDLTYAYQIVRDPHLFEKCKTYGVTQDGEFEEVLEASCET